MNLVYSIVVGLIAVWLAGRVMKGDGHGVFADTVIGVLGGIVRRLDIRHVRHRAGRRTAPVRSPLPSS